MYPERAQSRVRFAMSVGYRGFILVPAGMQMSIILQITVVHENPHKNLTFS